jgi:tetratricopeptide (TPR) repeat protein
LKAIGQFRAEEPEYHYLREILPLQAELQRAVLENLKSREADAWRLSDQAKSASLEGDAETALRLADETIGQYPETGGALLARKTKAQALQKLKRDDELRAVCQEITDYVGQVAPNSELARFAASEIAFYDGIGLYRQIERRPQQEQPTSEEWQRLRTHCLEVMAKHQDPAARATMHEVLISSYYRQGAYEEVVKEEQRFIALHGIRRNYNIPEFKRLFVTVWVNTAQSLANLARYAEARQRCDKLIALAQSEPALPPAESERCLKYALTVKCVLLFMDDSVATKEEANLLAAEIQGRWPGSREAMKVSSVSVQ